MVGRLPSAGGSCAAGWAPAKNGEPAAVGGCAPPPARPLPNSDLEVWRGGLLRRASQAAVGVATWASAARGLRWTGGGLPDGPASNAKQDRRRREAPLRPISG